MRKSEDKLKRLEIISPFSVLYAKRMGISQRMLNYYVKNKKLVRVAHGIYSSPFKHIIDPDFLLRQALLAIPQGIVGLKTALKLYGIWGEGTKTIEIIVPTSNVPKKKLSDVRLYRVNSGIYKMDTTFLRDIPITKLERTLVDLIRSGEPLSVVFAICRKIQHMKLELDFAQLKKLAKTFRVKAKMDLLLEVLPEKRLQIP